MKDRIKLIMEKENLTPARFADKLQINRAIVSHILNGRNNPSLDVVTKILDDIPYINPEWLLKGTGNMYKEGYNSDMISPEPDLFRQLPVNNSREPDRIENSQETDLQPSDLATQLTDNKIIDSHKTGSRKITQIIIYYSDNTYETFNPYLTKG